MLQAARLLKRAPRMHQQNVVGRQLCSWPVQRVLRPSTRGGTRPQGSLWRHTSILLTHQLLTKHRPHFTCTQDTGLSSRSDCWSRLCHPLYRNLCENNSDCHQWHVCSGLFPSSSAKPKGTITHYPSLNVSLVTAWGLWRIRRTTLNFRCIASLACCEFGAIVMRLKLCGYHFYEHLWRNHGWHIGWNVQPKVLNESMFGLKWQQITSKSFKWTMGLAWFQNLQMCAKYTKLVSSLLFNHQDLNQGM